MNATKITQTFNGMVPWVMAGNYFKLMEAANPVTVELFRNGQKVLTAALCEAGFYQRVEFDRVEITNPVEQSTAFLVAGAEGGSDRLAGEVSVIDGSAQRSLGGTAFISLIAAANLAANYSHVQLWNPADSGKRAFVNAIDLGPVGGAAYNIQVMSHTSELTSAYSIANPRAKKLGGTASTLKLRYQTNGSVLGTLLAQYGVPATEPIPLVQSEPFLLLPGYGLVFVPTAVNQAIVVNVQHYEEDNI